MESVTNTKSLTIGIPFNVHLEDAEQDTEHLSEESVAQTARDVREAVTALGCTVVLLPVRRSVFGFLDRLNRFRLDVLINLCEGFLNRPQMESNVAGLLEMLRIPFTGNDSKALALCQDKFKTKAILQKYGLPTALGILVSDSQWNEELRFPLIVKPNNEDASLGIYASSVVANRKELENRIGKIRSMYNQPVLVEEYIDGREFNVAVWEDQGVNALPVSEIDFSDMPLDQPHICGYEAKWYQDHDLYRQTKPVCPASLPEDVSRRIQKTAVEAFVSMGCRDYARVDFRMRENGELAILEVNPNPDISHSAGFARALKSAGIDYPVFWEKMIQNAFRRKEPA